MSCPTAIDCRYTFAMKYVKLCVYTYVHVLPLWVNIEASSSGLHWASWNALVAGLSAEWEPAWTAWTDSHLRFWRSTQLHSSLHVEPWAIPDRYVIMWWERKAGRIEEVEKTNSSVCSGQVYWNSKDSSDSWKDIPYSNYKQWYV